MRRELSCVTRASVCEAYVGFYCATSLKKCNVSKDKHAFCVSHLDQEILLNPDPIRIQTMFLMKMNFFDQKNIM
jgi:hypothetical protein